MTLVTGLVAALFLLAACSSDSDGDGSENTTSPAAASTQSSASTEKPKDPAADFELVLFENDEHQAGQEVSLSQFAGDPIVLNFWFPSCPPCVAEMPDFETAYQKFKDQDVKFIGVQLLGLDTVEDGQKFVHRLDVNYMLGPDRIGDGIGDIVKNYRLSGFPTTIFIDRDQNVNRRWSGALNLEKLEELIGEIL